MFIYLLNFVLTHRYYHSIYDDGERLDYSYDAGEDQAIVERISK